MKYINGIIVFAVILSSCAHKEGPYVPAGASPSIEDVHAVVLLDKSLKKTIAVDHVQGYRLQDDRLEVKANIRNRIRSDLQIQVQTIFKDESGFSTGEDSAWMTLFLNDNESKTYSIVSRGRDAQKFTIRIREVR